MIVYFVVSLISVLIAASQKRFKYALEAAFIVVTVFFAIRFEFGSDYPEYLKHFYQANEGTIRDAFRTERMEDGWVLMSRLFQPIGFFGMVIVLTIFENFVLYRMFKKYVPKEWYWLSMFCFLFSSSLCLTGLSMMRQFLAMCICLIAFDFAVRKKFIFSVLLVLVAGQFHTSAYICLIVCLISLLKEFRITKMMSLTILLMLIVFDLSAVFFWGEQIQYFINNTLFDIYAHYETLATEYESNIGISTFFNYFLLIIVILMQRMQDRSNRLFVLILLLFCIVDAFKPVAPLVGRVGLYFYILFPICLTNAVIKTQKIMRLGTIILFVAFRIYGCYSFITTPGWGNSFLEYRTIFSVSQWM